MSAQLSVADRNSLIKAAFEAKEYSYSPYSLFRVGAALLGSDGKVIKGANIENASYGVSVCAERTAIVKAVSEGTRSFRGLAVVTDVASSISPCGLCRQVIREFCVPDMPILLIPADYPQALRSTTETSGIGVIGEGGVKETTLGELLPDSFGPQQLQLPRQ